jgi:hypothetical protein
LTQTYCCDTAAVPKESAAPELRYSDATLVLDEIDNNKSETY